ncbi:MAG TPA: HEAT repeat domain-containing protein [Poseidonia sp.]|nr:HEAT repeat domain-containing protein [Poseidonia sp.]
MEGDERKPQPSQYGSVDPAPPNQSGTIANWRAILQDDSIPMFQRMRAVFSLRNERSDDACLALCAGFTSTSALLRHELAYVLGQMQNSIALPTLTERLCDAEEHVMVRHEAAEAMGAIGDRSIIPILEKFSRDPLPEISESCIVALDLLAWVSGSEFETTEW